MVFLTFTAKSAIASTYEAQVLYVPFQLAVSSEEYRHYARFIFIKANAIQKAFSVVVPGFASAPEVLQDPADFCHLHFLNSIFVSLFQERPNCFWIPLNKMLIV